MDDKQLFEELKAHLRKRGYVSYSLVLDKIGVAFDNGEIAPGYTTPRGIVLDRNLNLAELSLVARHEALHNLLGHTEDDIWGDDREDRQLRNMAGDLTLSHFYDVADQRLFNAGGAISGGLNVYRRRDKEFLGMDEQEAYDKLLEKQPPGSKAMGDCIQVEIGIDAKDVNGKSDQPGQTAKVNLDELPAELKKELLEGIKADTQKVWKKADLQSKLREAPEKDPAVDLYYSLRRYFTLAQNVSRTRTFARPNKKYQGDIVKKGKKSHYQPSKTLVVYVDRSGSMTPEKTEKAESILSNTVKRLKNVKCLVYYFSDQVSEDGNISGGTNYSAVINHINSNRFACVAIVTDNDNDGQDNLANVDAAWVVSVQHGYKTNLESRLNANVFKEVVL